MGDRRQLLLVVFSHRGKVLSHGSVFPGFTLCLLTYGSQPQYFVDGTDRLTCPTCSGILELLRTGERPPANIRAQGAPTPDLFAIKEKS